MKCLCLHFLKKGKTVLHSSYPVSEISSDLLEDYSNNILEPLLPLYVKSKRQTNKKEKAVGH